MLSCLSPHLTSCQRIPTNNLQQMQCSQSRNWVFGVRDQGLGVTSQEDQGAPAPTPNHTVYVVCSSCAPRVPVPVCCSCSPFRVLGGCSERRAASAWALWGPRQHADATETQRQRVGGPVTPLVGLAAALLLQPLCPASERLLALPHSLQLQHHSSSQLLYSWPCLTDFIFSTPPPSSARSLHPGLRHGLPASRPWSHSSNSNRARSRHVCSIQASEASDAVPATQQQPGAAAAADKRSSSWWSSVHDRDILALALPAALALAADPLLGMVDTALIGRLGADELVSSSTAGN